MHSSTEITAFLDRRTHRRAAPHSAIRSRTLSLVTLGILILLAACRDARAAAWRCEQYPIPWRPAAGGQAAAQTELASWAPGATMAWNANTGTLSSIFQLAVPLPRCTDGQDVWTQVRGALAAHPTLFQFNSAEWQVPEPFDCKYVGDGVTLSMGRRSLAGQPVAADVFVYSLKRINGVVYLTFVNGTYLPVIDTAIGRTMSICNNLTEAAAAATARRTPLNAGVFSQCRKTGTVTYKPKASDSFRYVSGGTWTWQADASQVSLTGQRTLRVIVDPANYTPTLLSSDARCPVADGDGDDFTVGFDITFDVHTGAILSVKPGLDCVVC